MKRTCTVALFSGLLLLGCGGKEDPSLQGAVTGGPRPSLSTPTLSSTAQTQTTLTIRVCAGETGAPAGFTLHWSTAAEYNLEPAGFKPTRCGGSFSGNAADSRFDLAPYECTDVELGALSSEPGLSYQDGCNAPLACGTEYVVEVFAHATRTHNRSPSSNPPLFTATAACNDGCTFTQGYWKNHEESWPVSSLRLGNVNYAQSDLLAILRQPVRGNGLVSLAHQLIAAKLNVASGASASAVADAIRQADALVGSLVVPPVGSGALATSATAALTSTLDSYNNGVIGPGHCE